MAAASTIPALFASDTVGAVGACCAPPSGRDGAHPEQTGPAGPAGPAARAGGPAPEVVELDGGTFRMGSDTSWRYPEDGEGPVHQVTVAPFAIAPTAVTNDEFATFVEATGHLTDAERFRWSFVFAGFLPDDFPDTRGVVDAPWWRQVFGATWRQPEGPGTHLEGRGDHPVVHVSHTDALAYCAWVGGRLPTEAEWEYAARGGRRGKEFPWGDDLEPGGRHRMNVFQGRFPADNSGADGYLGTAPVDAYEPNGFGLHNVTGNVWEWCHDWFDPGYYERSPTDDPAGPDTGTHRVMRGGSYLCHESYCRRYRVSARSANTADSSTGNLGFRVAVSR